VGEVQPPLSSTTCERGSTTFTTTASFVWRGTDPAREGAVAGYSRSSIALSRDPIPTNYWRMTVKAEITYDPAYEIMKRSQTSPDGKPRLHVVFEAHEIPALKKDIIDRALNTLDSWPPFADELDRVVSEFINANYPPPVAP